MYFIITNPLQIVSFIYKELTTQLKEFNKTTTVEI